MHRCGKHTRWAASASFLAALFVLPALGDMMWILLFLLAAALHEGGHLLALALTGGRVEGVCFRLSGGEIRYGGSLSYRGDLLVALAGPGANLLCILACAAAARRWPVPELYQFIGCHVTLAAFNLLPALPLDGGRVLQALLEVRFPLWGEFIARTVGLLVGLGLVLAGLFTLKTRLNPTLAVAGGVILLRSDVKNTLHTYKNMLI